MSRGGTVNTGGAPDIVVTGQRLPQIGLSLSDPNFGRTIDRPDHFGGITVIGRRPRIPVSTCESPPPANGTNATSESLANQARTNAEAIQGVSLPQRLFTFKSNVQNKGIWDYKQYNHGFQRFGNYNYGYTGAAAGFSTNLLLRQAGRAQIAAGTSRPEWQNRDLRLGSLPPYGDDPADQADILKGIEDYKRCNSN